MELNTTKKLTELLEIQYPIIQAGMIWVSGWRLAAAVSNAGGLGTIGSGSMYPKILDEHITKCKQNTNKPFAVNLPLLYPDLDEHIEIIIKHHVPIVITSAGSPKKYTQKLKAAGCKVIHVVSSSLFAKKAEDAGCDAVIAEGFEAGGHNGREETTTLVLIPQVAQTVYIPVIAAGGIATGAQMLASIILGASGVQVGSAFVPAEESSAHNNFKKIILEAKEGDTTLTLKKLTPVRLLHNHFFKIIVEAESSGASKEVLAEILGQGRAKRGMFEGDLEEGELEIGQVSSLLNETDSASNILKRIHSEYESLLEAIQNKIF